jgi:4-carboxymuconolactone decarboxylase
MHSAYEKGMELLKKLHGGHSGEQIVNALGKVSPKLVKMSIEWVFGDVMQSQVLDLKTREWIILATLIAQSHWPQVKAHIQALLHIGASKEEIVEMIVLMSIYAGFPSAVNAMLVAKEVFSEV